MKIVILVESFSFGGAERQVCVLAGEFKRRGHDVCVVTYHRDDFYLPLLERGNVEHRFLGGRGRLSWALNVAWFLRMYKQDVVLAFLPGPSAYAEVAGLPRRSWGLVVSERSSGNVDRSWLKTYLHTFADCIVTNSHSARIAIANRLRRLHPKLVTIYNAVRVSPPQLGPRAAVKPPTVKLVVAAALDQNKNPRGLLLALQSLRASQPALRVQVDWYGSQDVEPGLAAEIRKAATDLGLEQVFRIHPATNRIHDVMSEADAVVLASFYEGLPNAVCEGMALGKPILMSAVGDAGYLVQEGVNGFLFDPRHPNSIAGAMTRFAMLSPDERNRMGEASRGKAETLFDAARIADHYLRVLEAAAKREPPSMGHWPPIVPGMTPEAQRAGPFSSMQTHFANRTQDGICPNR